MRQTNRFFALLLVLLLATTLVGCGKSDQVPEAYTAMKNAAAEMNEYTERDQEIARLMQETEKLQPNAKNANELIALVDDAIDKLDEQLATAEKAKAEYGKIALLDVPSDFKAYAAMLVEITDKHIEGTKATKKLAEDMRELFDALGDGKAGEKRAARVAAGVGKQVERLSEIEKDIYEQQQQADEFFAKKLSEGK